MPNVATLPASKKEAKQVQTQSKKVKVIPIKPLNECVYLENYRFYSCELKKCKNWSDRVTTNCLGIDRVNPLGNKQISDSEILLYKLGNSNIQLRMASLKRKEAVDRVKCIYILDRFLEWIRTNGEIIANHAPTKVMLECEKQYPLKHKVLGFASWMWYYMTEQVYEEFASRIGGETTEYGMKDLLCLGATQYKHLFETSPGETNGS